MIKFACKPVYAVDYLKCIKRQTVGRTDKLVIILIQRGIL